MKESFDIHVHRDREGFLRASFTLSNGRRTGSFHLEVEEVIAVGVVAELAGILVGPRQIEVPRE